MLFFSEKARGALLCALVYATMAAFPLHPQEEQTIQILRFSGYDWTVRRTSTPEGPKNNRFGGRDVSVTLNKDGSLTLWLTQREGIWYAGEVTLRKSMGYGTYLFRLRTAPASLDPNSVLGLFTYTRSRAYNHREIDIEFSAWGEDGAPVRGQYVIQPYTAPGHLETFDVAKDEAPATYSFTWTKERIDFASWRGYGPRPEAGSPACISAWSFSEPKGVPPPNSFVHMNFYLADGAVPPSGCGALAVTIDSFEFIPIKK